MAVNESDGDDTESSTERWREWFLLDGPRLHVATVTVAVLFALLAVLSVSGLVPLRSVQPLFYAYGGMISGNLTVVTVVVAINQLLLSRELYTPDELESQMAGVIDYREDIREIVDQVPPVEPLGFYRLLVEASREEAQSLGGLTVTEADEELHDELQPLVSDLTAKADEVDALLQKSDPSTFHVLSTTLTTNYSKEVNQLRRIQSRHDRLPDDVEASIESLVDYIEDIDVARQYFRSIYIQEELASLSRQLFYVGLGSLVVLAGGLLVLTTSSGASIPRPYLPIVVAAVITVGLSPLSLLFAFIVRIATVSERTAALFPFTTPKQEQ